MREHSVPAVYEPSPTADLTDLIYDAAAKDPDHASFARKVDDDWVDVTAAQFLAEVEDVAKGLVAAGIAPGDRVGLMSRTRYEWTLVDFAIWCAGAVTVPIYETSSVEQARWILEDSGAVACVVEDEHHEATVASTRADLPTLREVWRIEHRGSGPRLHDLFLSGAAVPITELESRRAALTPDSLATLIYTSGTTGRPKGCELTHGNFLAELGNAVRTLDVLFTPDASTLLFLPLAHVFARIVEIGCVLSGAKLGHTPDIKTLVTDLTEFQPTFILAVPRVFEKVFNSASMRAHAESALRGRIFDRAVGVAITWSEGRAHGRISPSLQLRHAVFDRLVYAKVRATLGGRVRHAISGGAPLGDRLGHFFRGLGLTVLEGYGLTETTAAVTVNRPSAPRIGTVGPPLPGTSIGIADDGEVLVRGGQVMRGYWRNAEASADVLGDGWLRTGDLGELDDAGYLSITGRKKEILVTAGGKNVAPAVLEDRLRAHPLVSQCLVVGDRRPYIAALVTIDPEFFAVWVTENEKPSGLTVADAVDDTDLRVAITEAVDEANAGVSKAEAIKRFRILPVDFTEGGGHLTPSLKIKRAVVMEQFATDIDALYG